MACRYKNNKNIRKNVLARPNSYDIITYCRRSQSSFSLSAIGANVAQLAERLIRNEQVNGSSPFIGSIYKPQRILSSLGQFIGV